jgi:hypothetical protein
MNRYSFTSQYSPALSVEKLIKKHNEHGDDRRNNSLDLNDVRTVYFLLSLRNIAYEVQTLRTCRAKQAPAVTRLAFY